MVIVAAAQSNGLPRLGVDLHGPLSLQVLGDFIVVPGLGQKFIEPAGHPDLQLHPALPRRQGRAGDRRATNLCKARKPPLFHVSFVGWNGVSRSANVPATVQGCR